MNAFQREWGWATEEIRKSRPCNHNGFVTLLVDTTPHHKCYGEFYGKCTNCGKFGPSCKTAYDAGRKFKEQTLKEFQPPCPHTNLTDYKVPVGTGYGIVAFCGTCCKCSQPCSDWEAAKRSFQLLENPILELHAKNTVNSNAPRTATGAGLLNSTTATTLPTLSEQYAQMVNSTYKQIQEALVATAPNPKPYFIVVSSEGHAAIPIQHPTQQVAQTEADRLTKLKPGVTFTVFEAKSSVVTPKSETKKTVYEVPTQYTYSFVTNPYSYPFGLGGKL